LEVLHELADRGLREVLEWSVSMECDWTYKQGCLGRGLAKALGRAPEDGIQPSG
jgi:hypothetical protein